jgi:hypothetical protein
MKDLFGGITVDSEYRTWMNMKARCLNPNFEHYRYYGGRGITICERWIDFKNFLKDMGPKPGPKFSIERINNNGNYEPSNCKWATKKEQVNNRRKRLSISQKQILGIVGYRHKHKIRKDHGLGG